MKYSRNNGALYDRKILSRWFGKKNGRPDDESWKLEWFIRNFISGCGWDVKWYGDFAIFNQEFGVGYVKRLPEWFAANQQETEKWAVIEKQEGKTVWAYFTNGIRASEWEDV